MKQSSKSVLRFTVLMEEPLAPEEAKQVDLGISLDARPILERWKNRNPQNLAMFGSITYVEDPSNKSDAGLDFGESIGECMDRIERRDKNAKMAHKNRRHRRNPNLDRKRAKPNVRQR